MLTPIVLTQAVKAGTAAPRLLPPCHPAAPHVTLPAFNAVYSIVYVCCLCTSRVLHALLMLLCMLGDKHSTTPLKVFCSKGGTSTAASMPPPGHCMTKASCDIQGLQYGRHCALLSHGAVRCQHAICGGVPAEGSPPLPQHFPLVQRPGFPTSLSEGQER